ncbi:MAG: type II secretion system F family protein [Armatimonadetes bacterium]|nr:type II secretion system F family protein [Armatimonadota bacterium]
MPYFEYTYRDSAGAVRTGRTEAENQEVLTRRLREQGLSVTEVKAARVERKYGGLLSGFARVKKTDLSVFFRQFSTMIDAGVSLVRCLAVLEEQTPNVRMKQIILDIRGEVESGQPLSRAMSKYPRLFDNLCIGLIRAGEVGGVLEETMQRLAGFLEKDVELRRKVKSAMTYPMLVVIVALGIVIGLVTFILPKFMQLFKDLGVKEFPPMTAFLMDFSHFLTSKWYFAIGILVGFIIVFRILVRTKIGLRLYDLFKLKAPVFGKLNHRICLARFSRTLGTLLVSGVPILQAMETVAGTVANVVIGDAILEARTRIREGDPIGGPLQKSKMFPPMVVQMVSIGEESGSLDQMLTKVADFYEAEVDAALQSLTAAIEPVMIVFLGGAVGFIVIAMFQPLIAVIQNLTSGSQ